MPLSLRLALRELRGGIAGVWLLLACLALGVAVMAGAGSLGAALRESLAVNARSLLGGDVALTLNYIPPTAGQRALLGGFGALSEAVQMRAMAGAAAASGNRTLVELKAVDAAYPLYGSVALAPAQPLAGALAERAGAWGAVADPDLLARLGLKLGDRVTVGAASFELRATIVREPDRVASPVTFGPRLMIAADALAATGLVQPGSLVQYVTLVRLAQGRSVADLRAAAAGRFPDAGWQIRDAADAAPGLRAFLDQLAMFLSLVGLATLLVGGIGVADGVAAFLDSRAGTIATLKCLGAPRRAILAIYGWQVAALAGSGVAIGLAAGAVLPRIGLETWGDLLPIPVAVGIYPAQLGLAAVFGGLVAVAFATWPLARAGSVSGAALFRQAVAPGPYRPGTGTLAAIGLAGLALAALAVATAPAPRLAAWFVGGSALAFGLFALAGTALAAICRRAARRRLPLPWRLALSSLSRPGAATRGVMVSLGLGLTVLATVALVQADLVRQIDQRLPATAPSFFFLDVPADQGALFDQAVASAGGRVADRAAMLRGRITRIKGVPVDQAPIAPEARWAVRGDRGFSTAADPPANARLVAGKWWPAGYDGPPLLSLDAAVAQGFGAGVGDQVTVNVLGREITLTIANLREVDYATLGMNFALILDPHALAGAPHGDIATVYAPAGDEYPIERAVLAALPSVTAINVREALDEVRAVMAGAAGAIRAAAAITLVAGALVLAGAVAAARRRRMREAVLLKVLGARRRDLLAALACEYLLLGAAAALAALVLGGLAGWGIVAGLLGLDWSFPVGPALATLAGGVAAVTAAGLLLTGRVLAVAPAPLLRQE